MYCARKSTRTKQEDKIEISADGGFRDLVSCILDSTFAFSLSDPYSVVHNIQAIYGCRFGDYMTMLRAGYDPVTTWFGIAQLS